MLVLSDLASYQPQEGRPVILAVGNFDGMHLGHRRLLEKVVQSARRHNGTAAVLTFLQHPQHILHPSAKPPLLTSADHKLLLLKEAGVELCFLLPFTSQFASIEPEDFVRDVLHRTLHVREVYLGYNARFGKERRGDSKLMHRLAKELGFLYEELEPVHCAGDLVSSSRIRTLVREGKMKEAAECLGRDFSVLARVVRGAGRGSSLGFPTANLEVTSGILPPLGVYPAGVREILLKGAAESGKEGARTVEVETLSAWKPGVLNYGYRPTFEKEAFKAVVEVYLFDFEGDLYDRTLEVVFHPRLRGELSFDGAEPLKRQILEDIETAKAFFASRKKSKSRTQG